MREDLRKRREEMGFTQKQVADLAGIDRSYYTNIELGHKNPSFAVVVQLKGILDIKDDYIFLNKTCLKDTKVS